MGLRELERDLVRFMIVVLSTTTGHLDWHRTESIGLADRTKRFQGLELCECCSASPEARGQKS